MRYEYTIALSTGYALCCPWTGVQKNGTFTEGHPLHIQARMDFDGDMTLDATGSSFDLGEIEAYNTSDPQTVVARMTDQGTANTLTLYDIAWNDVFNFTLTWFNSGTFDITIVCESDAVCAQCPSL